MGKLRDYTKGKYPFHRDIDQKLMFSGLILALVILHNLNVEHYRIVYFQFSLIFPDCIIIDHFIMQPVFLEIKFSFLSTLLAVGVC